MNILIVEDIESKAHLVAECLREAVDGTPIVIERARSVIGAFRCMKTSFDLLVLDLVLPLQDDETPTIEGGRRVIAEILNGEECRPPSHIICLTAFEEAAPLVASAVDHSLVHMVHYSESNEQWRVSLTAKTAYVARRIQEAGRVPEKFRTDIGIVTSSPLCELDAVKRLPGNLVAEFDQRDGVYYYTGNWTSASAHLLSVVACSAPRMGMTAASITANKLIERWRPRFLVMCGIAAATKKDVAFGDILVADSTFDYGSGKISSNELGERIFVPSPHQIPIDPTLHAILQRWEQDQKGMNEVRCNWHSPKKSVPTMRLGVLASGSAVVQDQSLVEQILQQSRKTVGIDMEAYGIFHSGQLASMPRPTVLVAKSVSDFANARKGDKWQEYAAYTSARFVYEFFTRDTEVMRLCC